MGPRSHRLPRIPPAMDQLPGVAAQFAGTLAVHTAKVVVGRRVDMFCKWLCCKLPGCSSPGPPAPSAEERARLQIQELIRQSLVDLPHAVTSDFDMKSLDALIQMAENDGAPLDRVSPARSRGGLRVG